MQPRYKSVLLFAFALSTTQAAPPTVNYLYPAGGQRGTTVTVTADGTYGRWPPDVWVDRGGIAVEPAKESGKLLITIAPGAIPGAYGIRLFDGEGAAVIRPFLVGILPEVMEREPNDDFKRPQVLDKSCVVVNGRLAKVGDVDTFALTLKRGQTLIASLEANSVLRSPLDGHLQVVSPAGFVLAHNDDYHGLDPQIVFPVPEDGTYLVRTFAFPAVPDAAIRFAGGDKFIYRLTLTTGPYFDYAYPLSVPRAAPGNVELLGWNLPPELRFQNVPIRGDGDRATLFHSDAANAVVVSLEEHAAVAKDSGSSRHDPHKLDLPITLSGRLERPKDTHYYRVICDKGQKLALRAEARTLGFPTDPVVSIVDRDGKQLAKAQAAAPGKDTVLDFTVPFSGPLGVTISDLFGGGGPRHVYRLQAGLARPDFALKLATDRFVLVPGKPLDITVTCERLHGFDKDIELDVLGVPEGVTVATIPTDNKKAKTVTLRLFADRAPYSGHVRVVGFGKGSEAERFAQAVVADLGTVTENLWLTVVK